MKGNKSLIPISALVVFGTITLAELEQDNDLPSTDQWLGFALAFFVLSALADLGLPIAGAMAVLAMVTVLLTRGDEALRFARVSLKRERREARKQRREKMRQSFQGQTQSPEASPV